MAALTQIAGVVTPEVFTPYIQVLSVEKSAFVQSGVIALDPQFDELLVGGGRTFNVPFWNDLSDDEAEPSSDDPTDLATPTGIDSGTDIAARHSRNHSWSSMDLASAMAGEDPQEAIAQLVSGYWVRQEQAALLNTLAGVFADNVANDTGDMVNSIVIGGAGTLTAANLFSAEAFIDTQQTLGDAMDNLVACSMNSFVFSRAKKNNLIDFIPDSQGVVDIPFFQGLRVIVDDNMPAVSDGNGHIDYTTYFFGAGSIAKGIGSPRVATEIDRVVLAGSGGGQEILVNRQEFILHPRGIAWQENTVGLNGRSATNAQLALAVNWNRVFDRKLIRLAALITNG